MSEGEGRLLVLYDGVCALCNFTVRFLLRIDRRRRLAFAPLQGATAAPVVDRHDLPDDLESFVVVHRHGASDERVEIRSAAALSAIAAVGGGWRLFAVLRLVPRPVRDWVYDRVAANRYRWFGRYETCPLPAPEQRDRFLP